MSRSDAKSYEAFGRWISDIEETGIVFVMAAGNHGNKRSGGPQDRLLSLADFTPQSYGRSDNSLVTVGGVDRFGRLLWQTTPEEPGQDGSITVYAQAVQVKCASNAPLSNSNPSGTDTVYEDGTSFASPAVVRQIDN